MACSFRLSVVLDDGADILVVFVVIVVAMVGFVLLLVVVVGWRLT